MVQNMDRRLKKEYSCGKIAYFSNTDFSLYNFRMGVMKEIKRKGFEVFACGNITKKELVKEIEKHEIKFINIPLKRSFDWWGGDILYFFRVYFFCRKKKINVCHNFTIKPCIYASLAQKMTGVPKIYCTITGLGYIFQENNLKISLLRKIVIFLYKFSFKFTDKVIFQNPDDSELFIKLGIIKKEKTKIIKSSGVDVDEFSPFSVDQEKIKNLKKEIDYKEDKIYITLVSRMLWQKGVGEFIEAAKKLKKKYNNLIFLLVGPVDRESPSGIPREKLENWHKEGIVKYLGERRDIREILAISDIFTFPSYYGEGVPKALLEAGAMGLPLVTTNIPGCKEVVDDNKNGFLIRPKDTEDLAEKIETLIKDEGLRVRFGKNSKEKILKEFDEKNVVKKYIEQIYKIIN